MNLDDRQRLWHFSRGERWAVIVLLTAIAVTLLVRRHMQRNPETGFCDTTWIQEEIPAFEKQLSKPGDTKKPEKTYRPRQQKLQPIEMEKDLE